jgi:hypothetical protein
MLINNVNTTGQTLTLTEGIHQVRLFNLETVDPLDYIRIIGNSGVQFQWRYAGETDWREPYSNNEFTEYADSIGQSLTIELNVITGGDFLFRTDDTFEYPNDDTPTNPIIDIEVLLQNSNYYSAIPSDSIGSLDNNILSTDNSTGALTAQEIQDTFFHGMVNLSAYGVEGSASLWTTEPGTQRLSLTVQNATNSTLLLWDGAELKPLDVVDGTQTIDIYTVSDEWGLVLLDSNDPSNNSSVSLDSIQWLSANPVYNFTTKGDTETDALNNTYMIGTGTGDYAASTLGKELMGNSSYLTPYGTEGSYVKFTDLANGVYQFDVDQLGKIDTTNNDGLFAYNGKTLVPIANNVDGLITTEIEVVNGTLAFIALDKATTTGTTDFTVFSLLRTGDLPYEIISLIPDSAMGDVQSTEVSLSVGTGTGDYAASTLGTNLVGDSNFLKPFGTEGSFASYINLENGVYNFNAILSKQDTTNNDRLLVWNGKTLTEVGSSLGGITGNTVDVIYGELAFIAMDVNTTTGTSDFTITDLLRVGTVRAPVPINLTPDVIKGDVDLISNGTEITQTQISTGTGDVALSTISRDLTGNSSTFSGLGTEGSYGIWNVENGVYEITYSLYTSEADTNQDIIYSFDGSTLAPIATRSEATIVNSSTTFISESKTVQVQVTNGQLTIVSLDTGDTSGTTQFRINNIERVGDLPEEPNYGIIETTELGENVTYTSWNWDESETKMLSTDNRKDVINFSTSNADLFEFSITYNPDLRVNVTDSSGNVIYSPVQDSTKLINTYTWDLASGEYSINIINNGTNTIAYSYALFAEDSADLYYSDSFNSSHSPPLGGAGGGGNQSANGVINPIWGWETGYYNKEYPNGLPITEVIEGWELYEEIDGYETFDNNIITVNAEEAGIYELGVLMDDGAMIDVEVYKVETGELVYAPDVNNSLQGKYQHFTWDMTEGTYEIKVSDLSGIITQDYYPWYQIDFHKGGNPNNVDFSSSHPPEWDFYNERPIGGDNTDFNQVPHNPMEWFAADSTVSAGTGLSSYQLRYSNEGIFDFGSNFTDRILRLSDYATGSNNPLSYTIINTDGETIKQGTIAENESDFIWIPSGNYRLIYSFSDWELALTEQDMVGVAYEFDADGYGAGTTISYYNYSFTGNTGTFSQYDGVDIFSFTLTRQTNLATAFNFTEGDFSDYSVEIRTPDGATLAQGKSINTTLPAGDYLLGVTGETVGDDNKQYSIGITNPYAYLYEEPPSPLPNTGKDLGNDELTGLNLGTLKPWETDTNTGKEYNQGYVYGSYHLGASYINEFIGGDDVSDWIKFSLDEPSYINFYHSGAIAEIIDNTVLPLVVASSQDSYSGNLQAYLQPGNYSIHFSSESSISDLFNASLYLSNSNPNYSD